MREAMADPRLGDKQRIELFSGLIKAELPQGRPISSSCWSRMTGCCCCPSSLRNSKRCGIVTTARRRQITSAFELSEAQVKELVAALEQGLKLKPSVTVDQSLIGGVRVALGDQVL